MLLHLADTAVRLESDSSQVRSSWRNIFGGALRSDANVPLAQILLELQLATSLHLPPEADAIYRDPQQIVDVYRRSSADLTLHFRQGALVHLSPGGSDHAYGLVTPRACESGQLEDVTYTTLAPLLRRQDLYLLHAAAVSTARGVLLLVGPTHSGKTTTGLALLLAGWGHLASDVVLLSPSTSGIRAHPTPGLLSARPKSFQLLPGLRRLLHDPIGSKPIRTPRRLSLTPDHWGKPDRVITLCFPELTSDSSSSLHPLPAAVALARLMEESVDRWDVDRLEQHMAFLERLCRQARSFRLALAPDVQQVPALLDSIT